MDFEHPPADPVQQCRLWFAEAAMKSGQPDANAMTLAVVDPDGRPSARTVLLKGFDEGGAVFYTNRLSRKGLALEAHPFASLLFHWNLMGRQIRIDGRVTEARDAESDAYFASRPRASKVGAWASAQSKLAESRAALDEAVRGVDVKYERRDVPRPPHWGGYRVSLDQIEFWQGHVFRLHDRVVYTRVDGGGWYVRRLFP